MTVVAPPAPATGVGGAVRELTFVAQEIVGTVSMGGALDVAITGAIVLSLFATLLAMGGIVRFRRRDTA